MCYPVIGPEGIPVMFCVGHKSRASDLLVPKGDPNAIPHLPPGWDWCRDSNICTATNGLPPDFRDKMCAAKTTVDISQCEQDYNRGKISFDKLQQCWDTKLADDVKCRAQVGKLTAPATQ